MAVLQKFSHHLPLLIIFIFFTVVTPLNVYIVHQNLCGTLALLDENPAHEIPEPLRVELRVDRGDRGRVRLQRLVRVLQPLADVVVPEDVDYPKVEDDVVGFPPALAPA